METSTKVRRAKPQRQVYIEFKMVENRATTPGGFWASTSVQCAASPFPALTLVQKVLAELAFKGVLTERENVGASTAEEPKRGHLGGRQASFSKETWRNSPASVLEIVKIRTSHMRSGRDPRTKIWTWQCGQDSMVRQTMKPGWT